MTLSISSPRSHPQRDGSPGGTQQVAMEMQVVIYEISWKYTRKTPESIMKEIMIVEK